MQTRPMLRIKHLILGMSHGRLGPGVLAMILSHRLMRLLRRPINSKISSTFSENTTVPTEHDLEIVQRVLNFWKCANQTHDSGEAVGDSLWNKIVKEQDSFSKVMNDGSLERIYEYLITAPTRSIFRGVLQGDNEMAMLKASSRYKNLKGKLTVQRFISLTEGIGGGLTVQNPEQGPWGINENIDFGHQLRLLDAQFESRAEQPNVFSGLLETKIGDRYFNQVDLMAINAALQIKRRLMDSPSHSLLEIGAGSGFTAYWCRRLGLGPIQIIDLPHVAVMQAFFLLKALPNDEIYLYGENPSSRNINITIFPHWAFNELPRLPLGLVFNQDSFSEMSEESVSNYLRWIGTLDVPYLFSINHESSATYNTTGVAQVNMSELLMQYPSYVSVSRNPNWVREGYVDELWRLRLPV